MYQHILLQFLLAFDRYTNDPTAMDMRLFKYGIEKKIYVDKTLLIFKRHREITVGTSLGPNSHLPIVVVYVIIGKHGCVDFETHYTSDSIFIIPKCMYDFSISTNDMLSTPVFTEVTVQEALDDIWNVYNRYNGWLSRLFSIFNTKERPVPSRSWRFLNNGNIDNGLPELLEKISLRPKDIFRCSKENYWLVKKDYNHGRSNKFLYYIDINKMYITVDLIGYFKDYHLKLEFDYSLEAGLHTDWLMMNNDILEVKDSELRFVSGEAMLKCLMNGPNINAEQLRLLAKAFNKLED